MRGMNKVLLGSLVLLLAGGFAMSASSDRYPSPPAPKPEAQAQDEYGIKDLQADKVTPAPVIAPPGIQPLGGPDGAVNLRGGIAGISGSLQAGGSGGAADRAATVEKSLRRLARDLR